MWVGVQSPAPTASPPGERNSTLCAGGWVAPMAGLDGCGKSRPHRDSIPEPSSPMQVDNDRAICME
jgi:hypothetical protein